MTDMIVGGINFGETTLNKYLTGTFDTLTFSCSTPGDLSVVYNSRSTYYQIIGGFCHFNIQISITPTFTTASGGINLSGLPVTASFGTACYVAFTGSSYTAPANTIGYVGAPVAASTVFGINYLRSTSGSVPALPITQFTSGSTIVIYASGMYQI